MERWLIIELLARKRRIRGDVVGCSVREAANLLRVSTPHAARAMRSLKARGFIDPVRPSMRRGQSTGWRITCLPFDGRPPTCEYQKVFDRAERRERAKRVKGQPFFTPELEEIDRETRAKFSGWPVDFDEDQR